MPHNQVTVFSRQVNNDANNETIKDQSKERQVFVGLSVNMQENIPTAEVTSVRGPDGVSGTNKTNIDTIETPLKKDVNGNVVLSKISFRNSGGLIPLGQVHTHNIMQDGSNNIPGISPEDKSTSMKLNIPVFAIDSYTGNTAGGNTIHRVNPNGRIIPNIGTSSNHSIGRNVLNHLIGL